MIQWNFGCVTFLIPSWNYSLLLLLMLACLPALAFSYWWIAVFAFGHLLSLRYRFNFCNTCCKYDLLDLWLVPSFFSDLQFQQLPEVLQANSWCKLLPEPDFPPSMSGTQSNKDHFQHILILKPSVWLVLALLRTYALTRNISHIFYLLSMC